MGFALRGGSSAAAKALPGAGKIANALAADSSVVTNLARGAPLVSLVVSYEVDVASGESPNKAMAQAVGSGIGTALGGLAAGGICAVPAVGNASCVGVFLGSTYVGGLLGQKAGAGVYDAARWLGHVFG
jgi:hypothetical protein